MAAIYLIKDEKLVKKKVEILQIIENKAIIKGLKNNDVMLGESVKDSYGRCFVRIKIIMKSFIKYFIKYPVAANVIMLLIIVFGCMGLFNLRKPFSQKEHQRL